MGNRGVWRPLCLGAEQSHSVTGSDVANRLQRPLFKQTIVTDKRVNVTLMNGFVSGSCLFLDVRAHTLSRFLDSSVVTPAAPTPLLSSPLPPAPCPASGPLHPRTPEIHRVPPCLRTRVTRFWFTEEKTEARHEGLAGELGRHVGSQPIIPFMTSEGGASPPPPRQDACQEPEGRGRRGTGRALLYTRNAHPCRGHTGDPTDVSFLPYDLSLQCLASGVP